MIVRDRGLGENGTLTTVNDRALYTGTAALATARERAARGETVPLDYLLSLPQEADLRANYTQNPGESDGDFLHRAAEAEYARLHPIPPPPLNLNDPYYTIFDGAPKLPPTVAEFFRPAQLEPVSRPTPLPAKRGPAKQGAGFPWRDAALVLGAAASVIVLWRALK